MKIYPHDLTKSHITFDGLKVVGAFYLLNGNRSANTKSIEIKNCDISVGWNGDGNWSAIYLEEWDGNWVHHNHIYDVKQSPGALGGGAGIKLYTAVNSVIEYNTIDNMSQCAACSGIDDKQDSVNNVHRYNFIKDATAAGIRINNQNRDYPAATGTKIYGNVINNAGGGVSLLLGVNDIDIYNNTFYNVDYGVGSVEASVSNVHLYNNITNAIAQRGDSGNMDFYLSSPIFSNYNAYQAGKVYRVASVVYRSLGAYQSATGLEVNSNEYNCQFSNAAMDDFHIQAGTSCAGTGRTGGTSNGSVIEPGAYGVTSCVGDAC